MASPPTPPALLLAALMVPALGAACVPSTAEWMDAAPQEPTVFAPGVVSTGQREYAIAFTPDGRETYFTRRGRRGPSRILVTRYEGGAWTEPEPAPFGVDRDEAPFIGADGGTMLFASRRPMAGSWDRSQNIWIVRRRDGGWSDPEPLPGDVNQPRSEIDDYTVGTEMGPSLLANGALLYWTRVSPDWGSDIYIAEPDDRGAYVDPRPLRLNSTREETNATLSPDGRHLIFQGYRSAGGYGDDDLYVSERTEYGWSEPRLLPPPINSDESDGHPRFSPDGRLFFFSSDRDRRYDDIYVVSTASLGLNVEPR